MGCTSSVHVRDGPRGVDPAVKRPEAELHNPVAVESTSSSQVPAYAAIPSPDRSLGSPATYVEDPGHPSNGHPQAPEVSSPYPVQKHVVSGSADVDTHATVTGLPSTKSKTIAAIPRNPRLPPLEITNTLDSRRLKLPAIRRGTGKKSTVLGQPPHKAPPHYIPSHSSPPKIHLPPSQDALPQPAPGAESSQAAEPDSSANPSPPLECGPTPLPDPLLRASNESEAMSDIQPMQPLPLKRDQPASTDLPPPTPEAVAGGGGAGKEARSGLRASLLGDLPALGPPARERKKSVTFAPASQLEQVTIISPLPSPDPNDDIHGATDFPVLQEPSEEEELDAELDEYAEEDGADDGMDEGMECEAVNENAKMDNAKGADVDDTRIEGLRTVPSGSRNEVEKLQEEDNQAKVTGEDATTQGARDRNEDRDERWGPDAIEDEVEHLNGKNMQNELTSKRSIKENVDSREDLIQHQNGEDNAHNDDVQTEEESGGLVGDADCQCARDADSGRALDATSRSNAEEDNADADSGRGLDATSRSNKEDNADADSGRGFDATSRSNNKEDNAHADSGRGLDATSRSNNKEDNGFQPPHAQSPSSAPKGFGFQPDTSVPDAGGLSDAEDDHLVDHIDPASAAAELAGTWNFSGFETGQLVLQVGGDGGRRLEGSLSGRRCGAVAAGEVHVGRVYKGATRKEDLCVKLMLRADGRSFRGWYFQKNEPSLGSVWDAKLRDDAPASAPFEGEWDVKDLGEEVDVRFSLETDDSGGLSGDLLIPGEEGGVRIIGKKPLSAPIASLTLDGQMEMLVFLEKQAFQKDRLHMWIAQDATSALGDIFTANRPAADMDFIP